MQVRDTAAAEDTTADGGGPVWGRPRTWVGRTAVALSGAWVALIALTAWHRPDFLSRQTMLAVGFTMAIVGVLAVGQAVIALSGGLLDLSIPAAVMLPAYVCASLLTAGVGTPVTVIATLAAGTAWGLFNASVIILTKVNPIIVTLGTSFVGIAVLQLTFNRAQSPTGSAIRVFGTSSFANMPNIWWPMVLTILVAAAVVEKTRIGRRLTAVGGNPDAAKLRGISLRWTRIGAFTFAGTSAGLAGLLFAASSPSFTASEGNEFLLPVVAAVLLAGVSLRGGRANMLLLLLSVGLLSTVPTSLVFFGLESAWQRVFEGVVLIIAVSLDGFGQRRSAR